MLTGINLMAIRICGHLEDVPNLEQSSLNLVADLGSRGHAGANSVSSITTSAEVGHRAQIDQRCKEQNRVQKQGAETGCRNRVQKQGAETGCKGWRGIMRNRTRKQSINA
jgi:hypothetical protein